MEECVMEFKVIDKKYKYIPINYGDGYQITDFIFDRDITKEEFEEFCKKEGLKIHRAEGWWDDYSKIEGKGKWWTHTWVLTYDD
jgi:hypothetical protein